MKKLLFLSTLILGGLTSNAQITAVCDFPLTAGSTNDISPNLYTGTANGSASTTYDRNNINASAYQFYSGSDYISTNCPGVSGSANRTIIFWAKVPSGGSAAFNYGGGPLGSDFNLALNGSAPERFMIDISDETREFSCSVGDDKWHQYAISFDNTNGPLLSNMKFFQDGILLTNFYGAYNPGGHGVNTFTNTSVSFGFGNCSMDDVRMYAIAFSNAQIDSVFNLEAPANPCLISKYDFTGNANDGKGLNHGTVTGATLTTDRHGNANSAYNFTGTDYIDITSGISIANQDFTIGFWGNKTIADAFFHIALSQGDGNISSGLHCGITGTFGNPQHFGADFMFDGVYDNGGSFADSLNQWVQWYVTVNNTTHAMNLYCNGQLIKSANTTGSFTGTGNFRIGMGAWGGDAWVGKLDDIKIFGCELSPSSIDSLFQHEKHQCNLSIGFTGVTNITCFGMNDGSVTANGLNGAAPYSYSWQPGNMNTPTISSLTQGTYTVSVTDALGCATSYSVAINEPSQMMLTQFGLTQPLCPSTCSGGVFYGFSGGAGSETWAWSPSGQTTANNANGLCAGSHTVTVTDINGCIVSDIFSLTDPLPIMAGITELRPISCNSMCDGALLSSPSGGTVGGGAIHPGNPHPNGPGGYSIVWNPGNVIQDSITSICVGSYTVTITDANGCIYSEPYNINEPSPLSVSISKTDETCAGLKDGTANAGMFGGTLPYSYLWSNNETTASLTGLDSITSLSVIVTDAHGCLAYDTNSIAAAAPIALNLSASPSSCGSATGSVTSSPSGGVAPYIYYWNNSATTQNISSLTSGQYFLQITDANGCYASDVALVNDANGPTVTTNSITAVSCAGAGDGAIDINISGGALPYSIIWSENSITEDISSLSGGNYDVVVMDNNGCFATLTVNVNEPLPLSVSFSSTNSSCGLSDAQSTASVSGGSAPYSFVWDANAGSQTSATAINLGAGSYKVVATDSKGCIDSLYAAVSDLGGPVVVIDSFNTAGCIANGGNGAIYTSVTGTGPFGYSWTNGATTDDITNIGIGRFALTVTDSSSGCKGSVSQFISGLRPGTAQICLATVDTSNDRNVIVWNDTVVGVALYEIFRETSVPGQYNLIATIPAGTTNTFEDSVANADNKPWRYRIKATDSCGFESFYSVSHKPIHITIATGVGNSADLTWDAYQGVNYNYYYILRYHYTTGWMLIDSVAAGSPLVYHDATNIAPYDSNYYFIEVRPNVSCGSTRSIVNTSRSNIKNQIAAPTTGIETENETFFAVFPNPSKEEFNIRFIKGGKYSLKAYDARGRLVANENPIVANNATYQLQSHEWSQGVYLLQLQGPDGKTKNIKLIKQ